MPTYRSLARFTLVAVLLAPTVVSSGGEGHLSKLDLVVRRAVLEESARTLSVIIRISPGERPAVRQFLEANGASVAAEHVLINALTAGVQVADLDAIARHPAVQSVSVDAIVNGSNIARDVGAPTSTLRATLGLMDASPTGAGIGVALIDSGIEPNQDFDGRIRAFYDFVKAGGEYVSPYDDYGHGTHIAGLIGADGDVSHGEFKGVAPGVTFVGMKVLGYDGSGRTSDVIQAVERAVLLRGIFGIRIINLSLGHPIYESAATDPLVQAVEAAVRAGLIVMTSAGNFGVNPETKVSGYAGITSPGNAPSAITVGAFKTNDTVKRSDDAVSAYSSRGPTWYDAFAKPDLVAPGHRMVSNTSRGCYLYDFYPSFRYGSGSKLMSLSGTSMATAVATGVAAVVLQANRTAFPGAPALTPNAVKAILQFTAIRMRDANGAEYDSLTQGAGALNAAGAISLASAINSSAPVGSWWLATSVNPTTTIGKEQLAWTQNVLWGNNILWGNAVYTNEAAWAQNIVWGYNIVWSSNIVWSANIVWSNNLIWGTNIVWGYNLIGTTDGQNIVWGEVGDANNIVWGNLYADNVVWGTNIVWSMLLLTAEGL